MLLQFVIGSSGYNKDLHNSIDSNQNDSDRLEIEIEDVDKKLQAVNGEIKVLETNRRNIMSNIKKVEELEGKYAAYQYYMDAIKRDGIPYELISKALPTIEGAVNDILAQIVDFSMILEMDGKNVNCYIVYDDDNVWPLELSSGMERFISSLAMRVGLINVSNLPRGNFLGPFFLGAGGFFFGCHCQVAGGEPGFDYVGVNI